MFTLTNILHVLWQKLSGDMESTKKLPSKMDFADIYDDYEYQSRPTTKVEMCQTIESSHINKYGHLSCGQLLKWVDISACLAAEKLAGRPCVTVSVDDLYFEDQVELGEVICLISKVNRAFNTSMEVGVKVTTEEMDGANKTICEAFLTFVAMNNVGRKVKLPPFLCESHSEEVCYTLADERRKVRISHSKTITLLLESYETQTKQLSIDDSLGLVINGSKTRVESVELVLPQHANHHGNTFGGQIMAWVENVGSISAGRFARVEVNLRSVDMVHFRGASHVGDRIILQAIVNCAFKESLEVGVRVEAYNCEDGKIGETRHVNSAFLTYETKKELPTLDPTHSEDGIRRHREAIARAKIRLDRRYILSNKRQEKLSVVLNDNNLMYLSLNNISSLRELASKTDWKQVSSEEQKLTLSTREQDGILIFKVSKKLCSSKVTDHHAYKILSDPKHKIHWDPLLHSIKLIHGEQGVGDCVYHTVMKSGVDKEEAKKNDFLVLYSCRKPSREGDSYIVAMRSVILEGDEYMNDTTHDHMEVACAGFIIHQEPGEPTEISYYNETNSKLVSYVTADVAGFSKLYSIVYKRMESYIVGKL